MAVFDPLNTQGVFTPVSSDNQTKRPSDVVAQAAPGIYAAAMKTGLSADEKRLIENWAFVQNTHKKLMGMRNEDAIKEYNSLDSGLQDTLQYYYQTDYAHKADDGSIFSNPTFKRIFGTDKGGASVGDLLKSPLRGLMALGAQYGRLINSGYNYAQAKIAGTEVSFDQAFNGKELYNKEYVDPLIQKYGGQKSFVAMKLLAGMTPGEIIDAWGPNDPDLLVALNGAFNDEENFKVMLSEFERAQISPGRTLGHKINQVLNINEKDHPDWFNWGTGAIDFAWQIFSDPLTYLYGAGPISKIAGKSEKAGKLFASGTESVLEFMSKPGNKEVWTDLSTKLGEYRKAIDENQTVKAAEIRTNIKDTHPNLVNDTAIELFTRGEEPIKDFDSAVKYFQKAENTSYLIRGRTNSIKYFREGAPIARRNRNLTTGIRLKTRELFKGKTDFAPLAQDYDVLIKELFKVGEAMDGTADARKLMAVVDKHTKKGIQGKIERLAARFPGNQKIFTSDESYAKTLDLVRQQAFVALGNKPMAEAVAIRFSTGTELERITLRKALDEVFMRRLGVDKVSGGEKFMSDILNSKYGYTGGMTSAESLKMPARFTETGEIGKEINVTGTLLPYQNTEALGALPWSDIQNFLAKRSFERIDGPMDVAPKLIGGAFNNHVVDQLTNLWSVFTLAPKLGIRTAIDEGFMFSLYLTTGMAHELINAKRAGNVMASYTGGKSATGPLKDALQGFLSGVMRKPVGARRKISDAERTDVIAKYYDAYKRGDIEEWEVQKGIKEEIFDMAIQRSGKNLSPQHAQWLKEAALINPRALETASAQHINNVLFGSTSGVAAEKSLLDASQLDKALNELGATVGETYNRQIVKDLTDEQLALAMYHSFYTAFATSPYKLGKNMYFSPASTFIKHNGLRDRTDYLKAKDEFMASIGFKTPNALSNEYVLINPEKAQKFLNQSRQNAAILQGEDIVKVASDFVDATFAELAQRFHGGADQFNEALLNHFKTQALEDGTAMAPAMVTKLLDFPTYKSLLGENTAKDMIRTPIDFGPQTTSLAAWALRYGPDKIFPAMARTTDDLFRQPVVHAHYFLYRKQYAALEKDYADQLFKSMSEEALGKGIQNLDSIRTRADNIAKHYFAEHAMEDAVHHTLKYSDNPEVRTMFAHNMRNAGRFYRAVEDFYRRMYRLSTDKPLSAIYRLRLMNQGLAAVGSIHHDQDGKSYLVMPMDDGLFHAVDTVLRTVSRGEVGVSQPLFNDITFKLSAGNPSFQDDAGVPYLSGPMGSLSVMGMKAIFGKFNPTKNLAEDLDEYLLGSMGDNVTLKKAVVPKGLESVWNLLSYDEKIQQETSATMQAISYYQAHGYAPDPTDPKYAIKDATGRIIGSDEEAFSKDLIEYKNNVKITAHNVLWLRNLLGLITPMAPTLQDSKDLPSYVKDVGINGMRDSLFDTVDQIERMYPTADSPYELALAMWTGKNKGKLAYTVSRSDSNVNVALQYSEQMQDWIIKHKSLVDEHGDAALLFAPRIGDFSPGVYNWAKAAELIKTRDLDSYINEVTMQNAINEYFDLYDQESKALVNNALGDSRRQILDDYENRRRVLKLGTPYLTQRIEKLANNEEKAKFLSSVQTLNNSEEINVSKETKDYVNQAFDVYHNFMYRVNSADILTASNSAEIKRNLKARAFAQLEDLSRADSSGVVKQITRIAFKGLMNARSRDAQNTVV